MTDQGPTTSTPVRLDVALVRRGLARSRGQARELVDAGRVRLRGATCTRPASPVAPHDDVALEGERDPWVSRAAHKLLAALEAFPQVRVEGRRCIDVGASTGGFTQVLLARGAAGVCALDVGHGQLAPTVAADPRVVERSGLSVRDAEPEPLGGPFHLLVTDLSFISLTLVAERLAELVVLGGDLVALIKPQFEVGRGRLGKGGVVRDAGHRQEAIESVLTSLAAAGLQVRDLAASPVLGTDGNSEYLVWCVRSPGARHDPAAWTARARRLAQRGATP
ncbi:TlyA family RNA methyltransferase [Arsenicicoccus dermatophilus]|uniref:TlyA family RNA methyltransferase n=1 Tax=Arsenicicoccus dermatophilus TaxID=1076331 RepID=UPI0039170B84